MSTDTLVSDIYRMIDTKDIPEGVPVEQVINDFGENVKQILRNNITRNLCLTLESSFFMVT